MTNTRTTRQALTGGVALAALLSSAAPAAAQARPEPAAVEEVIVTASKRSENLQDVPVSINAFSGARIAESGVKNIVDVQFLAAGLKFGQDREGSLRTSIRGISSNVGTESAVAVHLDGVYLGNRFDQLGAFFDLQRMEVLRGPQGTLYGRNATGGAINIITNDPTASPEGFAQVSVGNYSLVETEGFVSGPLLGDRVRGRVAFKTSNLPGYGTNTFSHERINGADSTSVRGKLDFDVTDTLQLLLSADYTRVQSSYDDEVSRLFPTTPLAPEAAGFPVATGFDSNANRPDGQDTKAYGGAAKVIWDLGPATLTSLTGYREVDRNNHIDIDASAQDRGYFRFSSLLNKQLSEELNLASTGQGPFKWIIGGFLYRNELKSARNVPLPLTGGNIIGGVEAYVTKAYALYGEATYAFTDRFSVTVGGRYSEENARDQEYRAFPTFQTFDLSKSSHAFTPKVAVKYEVTDDINLYATYSEGFKSGGFNPGAFDTTSFSPEKVKNYEAGVKSRLFDRRVTANLSAFSMKYSDLQVNTVVIISGVPAVRVVNAAEASIKGVELDVMALASEHVVLDGNAAYIDATYDEFLAADNIRVIGVDVSGNQMVGAPRFSANLGAEYRFEAGGWNGAFRGEYSYQSRIYFTPLEDLRGISQKPVGVWNARLSFKNPESDWGFAAWIRNITDEQVISSQSETNDTPFTGFFKSTTYRPPRTYGVTLSKSF